MAWAVDIVCTHLFIFLPALVFTHLPNYTPNMIRPLELSMWSVSSSWPSIHHYRSRKNCFLSLECECIQHVKNSDTCATRRKIEPRGVSAKQFFKFPNIMFVPKRVRGVAFTQSLRGTQQFISSFSVWLLRKSLWLPHRNIIFARGCEQGIKGGRPRIVSWLGVKAGLFRHSTTPCR